MKKSVIHVVVACTIAASLSACSPFSVDEGEIGLVTRYGEIQETKSAGLHWRSWLEDDVVFSTREQKVTIGKFDDVGDITSGISAYTRDTQTVTTALTITFKLTDPVAVYKNYRNTDNMINQLRVLTLFRTVGVGKSGAINQRYYGANPRGGERISY